jgi:hypothetical protein
MLDLCGGARQVLAEALAAVRRPNGSSGGPAEPALPLDLRGKDPEVAATE